MNFQPKMTKTKITLIFKNTISPLKNELPAVPRIRIRLINTTITMAGILTMPPSHGQAVNVWGKSMPAPCRKTTR